MITAIRLRSLLTYTPETGEFRWIKRDRMRNPDKPAGRVSPKGYRRIKIDDRAYVASRLAFLYMTGRWPKEEMDHIDCDPRNDAWSNLREASIGQNRANRRRWTAGGLKGAYYLRGRWLSQIMKDGKIHYLGCFLTAEEAHAAYVTAQAKLFGEFARFD